MTSTATRTIFAALTASVAGYLTWILLGVLWHPVGSMPIHLAIGAIVWGIGGYLWYRRYRM